MQDKFKILFILILFIFSICMTPSIGAVTGPYCGVYQGEYSQGTCDDDCSISYSGTFENAYTYVGGILTDYFWRVCDEEADYYEIECYRAGTCEYSSNWNGRSCYGKTVDNDDIPSYEPLPRTDSCDPPVPIWWNGKPCQVNYWDIYGDGLCHNYFGSGTYQWDYWGRWDANQNGKGNDPGCAKCYDDTHREEFVVFCDYTIDSSCKEDSGRCESACGADPRCDERLPGSWCEGNVKKTCTSNCEYIEKMCGYVGGVNGTFACEENADKVECKDSCVSDDDCAEGYRCYSDISKCWICDGDGTCERVTNSKPSLQEIEEASKKYPNAVIGVSSDMVYDLMEKGVSWKDSFNEKLYTNAYELLRDKGANWVRVMLFWNETQGLYNLDYINKSLHLASDEGFNIIVVLSFSDNWRDEGPHCINFNKITVHSEYDPGVPCKKFKDLDDDHKIAIMKEYAGNVSKFFENEGIDVKIYEIGSEIGIGGFFRSIPELPICTEDEYEWYKNNIWNQEADIIKDIIPELNKSNPDVLIQSHVDTGWQCREFVLEYYKTMLNKGVNLDNATISYYPSFVFKGYTLQEVHQNLGFLLSEVDWVCQKLLNEGYEIKFSISEFGYPSGHDLNVFFRDGDYKIQPFNWNDYCLNIKNWLEQDYCPKCQNTGGYDFSPEKHAEWLRDFYDAVNSDDNITGTFLLSPENAQIFCNNFCSFFDIIPETYDLCGEDCLSTTTTTTTIRGGGSGCDRWCRMLSLSNDSDFYLIFVVITAVILVLIFGVFKFSSKKK